MAYRKAYWCFTYEPGHKTVEHTSTCGKDFEYNNTKVNYGLGPIEQKDERNCYPHHHGWISCMPGETITKGKCIKILKELELYNEGQYVHERSATKDAYVKYCFKTSSERFEPEVVIDKAIKSIREMGEKPTKNNLVSKLAVTEGAVFVTKHKQLIDSFMSIPVLCQKKKRTVDESVDLLQNVANFYQATGNFIQIVTDNVNKNGIDTTHKAFEDSSRQDQVKAILINTLLPICVSRKKITDGLPALWLYGQAYTGKSFMYTQIPNYKHIATDAAGVSRYKLNGEQSGFLLDDIDQDFITNDSNASLVKKLAIGETTSIKVFGDVADVRGFLVVTSNHKPGYLTKKNEDEDDQAFEWNKAAFRRRFIALKFTEKIDFDALYVDFSSSYIDVFASQYITQIYEELESKKLKKLYEPYVNWLLQNKDEHEEAIIREYEEWLEEHDEEPRAKRSKND